MIFTLKQWPPNTNYRKEIAAIRALTVWGIDHISHTNGLVISVPRWGRCINGGQINLTELYPTSAAEWEYMTYAGFKNNGSIYAELQYILAVAALSKRIPA